MNPLLVGSCPSSGSTLLSVMLDAHPELICGPELTWLGHGAFWQDDRADWRELLLAALASPSSTRDGSEDEFCPWVDFVDAGHFGWYGWDVGKVRRLVSEASDVEALLAGFYRPSLARERKSRWADKSPTNLYGMASFLERCPGGRGIVLVRDGRDAVCSLVARGYSLAVAGALWLVETFRARALSVHERVLLIRFEDLVTDPEPVLDRVCAHAGLSPQVDHMRDFRAHTRRAVDDVSIRVDTWTANPSQGIDERVVGRWRTRLDCEQLAWLRGLHLRDPALSFADLLASLGYSADVGAPMAELDVVRFGRVLIRAQRQLALAAACHRSRVEWIPPTGEVPMSWQTLNAVVTEVGRLGDDERTAALDELAELRCSSEEARGALLRWQEEARRRMGVNGALRELARCAGLSRPRKGSR